MRFHPFGDQSGSYLVLTLPVFLILVSLLLFIVKLSGLAFTVERLKKSSDAILTSALSARAESLQTLAAAWDEVKPYLIGATKDEASISRSSWDALKKKTVDIKKSIPGYKGRIKSVLTVTGEANDIDRSQITILREEALDLGVDTLSQWVRDDQAHRENVPDLILHRLWSPEILNDQPIEQTEIAVKGPVLENGTPIERHSKARLHWDVNLKDDFIQQFGNGGYPRTWKEALMGSGVEPHRYPYYSVRIVEP